MVAGPEPQPEAGQEHSHAVRRERGLGDRRLGGRVLLEQERAHLQDDDLSLERHSMVEGEEP